MTIKCHEFFGCKRKQKCPYFTSGEERHCWEVELALTPFYASEQVVINEEHKIVFCENCLYYQHMQKI